jgi:hypothetical protein
MTFRFGQSGVRLILPEALRRSPRAAGKPHAAETVGSTRLAGKIIEKILKEMRVMNMRSS